MTTNQRYAAQLKRGIRRGVKAERTTLRRSRKGSNNRKMALHRNTHYLKRKPYRTSTIPREI